MVRRVNRSRGSRKLATLLLSGAGVGVAGASLGDELLAVVATDVEEHVRVDRVGGPGGVLSPDIGVTLRVGSALTSADGMDLLLFGQDLSTGQQYLWRMGRTASGPSSLAGPYQAIMGNRVLLSATASSPRAAWVGTESRHVALATGDARVTFHEPIERTVSGILAPATPPGWPSTQVALPAGFSARLLAAGGPTRLYVADGLTNSVLRLEAGAAPVTCTINGGGQVTAIAGLPSGGAVVTLGDATSTGGRLAVLAPDCSGPTDPATSPEPAFAFTAVASLPGAPPRVFASGNNGTLRAFDLAGASLGSPVTQNVDVGGAVAAALLGGTPTALVGGVDTGIEGYRLRQLSGGSFVAPVGDVADKARVTVAGPDPAFGLSTRIVELDSLPANQRVSLVRLYGAAGQTLRVYPGTCQRTSVLDAYDMGAQVQIGKGCTMAAECPSGSCVMGAGPGRCAPFLTSGAMTGGTLRPSSNDFILAVAQAGQGEDCQLLIASDTASAPTRGGGALLRVRGGTLGDRAIALVLDKSGSMFAKVDSTAASGPGSEVRVDALRNAVALFVDTVAQLPDAASAKFAVIPFNQQSSAGALPAAGVLSGTDLKAQYMDTILSPAGSTNIRGALKTAADRLAAQGGLQERSVLLLTDGLHNTVGSPDTNSASLVPDDVNNLEPPLAGATSTSAYLTAPAGPAVARRVDRLYAVGLSPMSVHPSLVNLVRHVNAPSSLEPIPPGYLDYSLRGNEVAQFFTKVLWGYMGATEFVDPLVTVDTGQPYSQDFVMSPSDRELIVAVSWLDAQRFARVRLTYQDTNGMPNNLVRCASAGQNGAYRVVCYADPVALKSNGRFNLTVTKDLEAAAGPLEVMVEVAGRSSVRLRTAFGQKVHKSGGKLRLLATLTEQGLPIPPQKGGKVTGTLSLPTAALGTVLANLKVDGAKIDDLRKRDPDQFGSGAAAKFSLLAAGQAPGRSSRPIELFDDGQHGDGQASDGVYGLEVDAPVPGIYRAQLRGAYATPLSGSGAREGSLATQVVVGLDGKLSLQAFTQYVAATKERPGSFIATLKPQDGAGNLLGPGNGADILFRQGDRTLPAKITEPPELDGTYTAEVSDIRPGVPVLLVGSGGGALLLRDPACDPTKGACDTVTPPGDDGCKCSLGRGAGGYSLPLPAALLGLLGLVLLARDRRRRR